MVWYNNNTKKVSWRFYDKRGFLKQSITENPLPVGLITQFVSQDLGTPTAPSSWLLCNGSSYSSSIYPELYKKLTNLTPPVIPVNFNVPNLNLCFTVGSSGTYPVKSKDGSYSRYRHNHGGYSQTNHYHINTHTHSLGNHSHGLAHKHAGEHLHDSGTIVSGPALGSEEALYSASGVYMSRGSDAPNPHAHTISGDSGKAINGVLDYGSGYLTDPSPAGAHDGSVNTQSSPVNTPIETSSDILPPYLNVYFIIKAE